jgi:hypothetical protein
MSSFTAAVRAGQTQDPSGHGSPGPDAAPEVPHHPSPPNGMVPALPSARQCSRLRSGHLGPGAGAHNALSGSQRQRISAAGFRHRESYGSDAQQLNSGSRSQRAGVPPENLRAVQAVALQPGPLEGVTEEGGSQADDGDAPGGAGSDAEVDATALQDAEGEDESITDSHYQRGKRFRRLHRLMSSPLVRADWGGVWLDRLINMLCLLICNNLATAVRLQVLTTCTRS